jgi:hypothetical protein
MSNRPDKEDDDEQPADGQLAPNTPRQRLPAGTIQGQHGTTFVSRRLEGAPSWPKVPARSVAFGTACPQRHTPIIVRKTNV